MPKAAAGDVPDANLRLESRPLTFAFAGKWSSRFSTEETFPIPVAMFVKEKRKILTQVILQTYISLVQHLGVGERLFLGRGREMVKPTPSS